MKKSFLELLKTQYIVLDGATGVELSRMGMPKGISPEKWILEHKDEFVKFQTKYVDAGSNVIYAPTFGANRIKLSEFGLDDKLREMNMELVALSKKAAGERSLVAGNLSPTGKLIKPFGDLGFEEAIEVYKEQVLVLQEAGVDLIAIETMMDIMEARAAILAVKENTDLPIIATMTFNEDGTTLMGNTPETACVALQSLGIDAVGCNCSSGPDKMIALIARMEKVAKIPLVAKPNAGMPYLEDGETKFDMGSDEFVRYASEFLNFGVKVVGGCCGTNSDYIRSLTAKVIKTPYTKFVKSDLDSLASSKAVYLFSKSSKLNVIGERINPTGKTDLKEALIEEDYFTVVDYAEEQIDDGANILDVNVGMEVIDEKNAMINAVEHLNQYTKAPLCIDSSKIEVIEAALRTYPGRVIVNSVSCEIEKVEKLLPIVKKYGAMFILLPLDDDGIAFDAKKRKKVIKEVYDKAMEIGFDSTDIIVDGLVMTASSNQAAAKVTLETIRWAEEELGTYTVIGLSNISFGLPKRVNINSAFLAMAMGHGLSFAIMNPSNKTLMDTKKSSDVLYSRDLHSMSYIESFREVFEEIEKKEEKKIEDDVHEAIYQNLLKGKKDDLLIEINKTLEKGDSANFIVDELLIPAITEVGILYEEKKYYLPQLIKSAQAMQGAFTVLEELLVKGDGTAESAVIVMATVKGDIHDIGKNIVSLMLKNYGYKVIDLGKDVDNDLIINTVKEQNADILGLSALMTTTMSEMETVINRIKEEKINVKVIVGGAVLSQKYADDIGADGYSEDAYGAVRLVKELLADDSFR